MAVKYNAFNSVADGDIVSAGTASSGDQVTISKAAGALSQGTSTAGEVVFGAKSLKMITASGESAYCYWQWSGVAAVGLRAAFRWPAVPGVGSDLLKINLTGGALAASCRLGTDGKITVRNAASTLLYTTPSALTLPSVFMLDLSVQPGVDTVTGKIKFAVYNATGTLTAGMGSAFETTTTDAGVNTLNSVNVGKQGSEAYAVTFEIDEMMSVDAYGLVGPYIANNTVVSFGRHIIIG